jgi:hypothetical protein
LIEPGLWQWRFQIGKTVTKGKTHTNLEGLAARGAESRIALSANQRQPR